MVVSLMTTIPSGRDQSLKSRAMTLRSSRVDFSAALLARSCTPRSSCLQDRFRNARPVVRDLDRSRNSPALEQGP